MANNTKGTLKYRKVKRIPPLGENAGKEKWYATVVTDRELSFEDFVNHISDHGSPYSRGCINGVLTDALDCLQELILDGKSVRLGDLGLFSIGMASKAEETAKDVSAQASRRCTSSCETPAPGATRSSARSASSRSTTPSALTALRPTRPALATTEAQAAPAPLAAPPPEAQAIQEALKAPEAATENRHPDS